MVKKGCARGVDQNKVTSSDQEGGRGGKKVIRMTRVEGTIVTLFRQNNKKEVNQLGLLIIL